jgi:hypothetical protein
MSWASAYSRRLSICERVTELARLVGVMRQSRLATCRLACTSMKGEKWRMGSRQPDVPYGPQSPYGLAAARTSSRGCIQCRNLPRPEFHADCGDG